MILHEAQNNDEEMLALTLMDSGEFAPDVTNNYANGDYADNGINADGTYVYAAGSEPVPLFAFGDSDDDDMEDDDFDDMEDDDDYDDDEDDDFDDDEDEDDDDDEDEDDDEDDDFDDDEDDDYDYDEDDDFEYNEE